LTADSKDTLLFYSPIDDPEPYRAGLEAALPEADFYAFPNMPAPEKVTVALVWRPPVGFFAPFVNLRLVVNLGAGVDSLVHRDDLPDVPIARLTDPGMVALMTSYVTFAVLRYARDIDKMEAAQREKAWRYIAPRSLLEIKVGVLGLGELGASAAQALAGFGLDVTGWSRTAKDIPGVRCLHGIETLDRVMAEVEILAVMLPLTTHTRGLITGARLRTMQPGAKLINAARGSIVDELALIAALQDGHIGGATLDVFEIEPLPVDSPVWAMPNVLVTPHLASIPVPAAASKVIAENVRRIRRGETPLHLADPARGY
jgi:glyoxylate/hydroxypyruvate reductase A